MNRYVIVESYYLYLSMTHEGQWSKKYARLCKLLKYFKPSPLGCNQEAWDNLKILMAREQRTVKP